MTQKIKIEIWSDLICPWCWIGKTRLEKALAQFPAKDRFEFVHRAYRLGPNESPRTIEAALAEKTRGSAEQVSKMLDQVESVAAQEGLAFHLRGTFYGDTADGQRLVLWSAEKNLQAKILERFFRAYFSEGVSLFERKNLLDLAESVGIDRAEAAAMLETDAYKKELLMDESEARSLGSRGVPFFLFGGKYAIGGAQPPETFLQVINELISE